MNDMLVEVALVIVLEETSTELVIVIGIEVNADADGEKLVVLANEAYVVTDAVNWRCSKGSRRQLASRGVI